MSNGTVSVVIPAKNSSETIERCLTSVREQTYSNIEIVVVDNHSDDNTEELARTYADQVIRSGPERCPQANIGAKAATGEWVYFVGADFELDRNLIKEAVTRADEADADAVLVHNHSDATVSRWARVRAFERAMYKGDDLNVASRFIRRDRFLGIGGFDETLIAGDDYDLQARLTADGAKFVHIDATELHLGEPKTLREVIRKHYFYGSDLKKYVAKYGRSTVKQLSPIRPAFLKSWRQFVRHPRTAALFFVYQVAKYAAGGAGWVMGGRGMKSAPTGLEQASALQKN